jgi:hypothetical protein
MLWLLLTLAVLAGVTIAIWRGSADSRDPNFSMGSALGYRPSEHHAPPSDRRPRPIPAAALCNGGTQCDSAAG